MTRLPFNDVLPAMAALTAPGREILRVERKVLPDGRVLDFVYRVHTWATPEHVYRTEELIAAPALTCGCTPDSPQDLVCCSLCSALVCASKHAATCGGCGQVCGSECLKALVVDGIAYMVCSPCARQLSSSLLRKAASAAWSWIWS